MRINARQILVFGVIGALCAALGVAVARPGLSQAETDALAARYSFATETLNPAPPGARVERTVAPGLNKIRGWISSVGAAAALSDLRGQGHAGDLCLVDPRDDSVTLRPVRSADPSGYAPVRLTPTGLPYDRTMAPMGCVPADIDVDGDIDHVVHYWGRSPVVFLNTGGPGAPTTGGHRAVELVTPMAVWNSGTFNIGDIDGDGNLDLVVGNYFPDGARVLDPEAHDETRMQMQNSMSLARNAGINRILLGKPTGRPDELPSYTDVSTALSRDAAASWTLATGLQDMTGDGLPELYQANDFGPDQFMVNRSTPGNVRFSEIVGERDWTTPKSTVVGRDSFKGMGVTFTYDGDAPLPSMIVSNITTPFALHESNFAFTPTGTPAELAAGGFPFDERSEELGIARAGWCWDVRSGDFDNDGTDEIMQANGFLKGEKNKWPHLQELAMGNDDLLRHPEFWPNFRPGDDLSGSEPNRFWVRGPDGRYTDLAAATGIAAGDNTRAIAYGDVDGDNKLDAVVANQWEDSVLLRNTAPAGPAADLRLVRPAPAGSGDAVTDVIGAQVRLHHPDRPQRAQLYPANGHTGVSAARLHLAIPGGGTTPATVTWRDAGGLHEATVNVRPGHGTILLTSDGTAEVR
ncbi:CRTAC1 family protein [Lentzea sp. NBRC 102530]|uniref:CRTAC1 family protein n=1 Tax=Lentzea sp. NBRC 102530 TaxID=3032201 RepID=UPI0024A5958A|nr:CRTAC1 family protein [Lentzea sp. NBRC 102530]GLY50281.1 RNA-binding protein [Lentzea sp. NBRC 102530]